MYHVQRRLGPWSGLRSPWSVQFQNGTNHVSSNGMLHQTPTQSYQIYVYGYEKGCPSDIARIPVQAAGLAILHSISAERDLREVFTMHRSKNIQDMTPSAIGGSHK